MGSKRNVKVRGKTKKNPTPSSGKYEKFKSGKFEGKTCPKCGPGIYMAEHQNRSHCGKCSYTEFK